MGIRRRPGMLGLVIAMAVAGIAAFVWLTTRLVVVDDRLARADFIYVLNGRIAVRGGHAVLVYAQGLAPRIVLSVTNEMVPRNGRPPITVSDSMARYIVARGVPDSAVEIIPFPGGVIHTRDEGRALRSYLERAPARRVIVVTADYHTGRARRTLRQELRGLDIELLMAAAPARDGTTPATWWRTAEGIDRYISELVQQVGAIIQHATGTGQAAAPSS